MVERPVLPQNRTARQRGLGRQVRTANINTRGNIAHRLVLLVPAIWTPGLVFAILAAWTPPLILTRNRD